MNWVRKLFSLCLQKGKLSEAGEEIKRKEERMSAQTIQELAKYKKRDLHKRPS